MRLPDRQLVGDLIAAGTSVQLGRGTGRGRARISLNLSLKNWAGSATWPLIFGVKFRFKKIHPRTDGDGSLL